MGSVIRPLNPFSIMRFGLLIDSAAIYVQAPTGPFNDETVIGSTRISIYTKTHPKYKISKFYQNIEYQYIDKYRSSIDLETGSLMPLVDKFRLQCKKSFFLKLSPISRTFRPDPWLEEMACTWGGEWPARARKNRTRAATRTWRKNQSPPSKAGL